MKADKEKNHQDLLRENSRLRGDLLTIAQRYSHDLRTPLGAIIGTTEVLKEMLAETDAAALSLVASSLDAADELSQLIRQVSVVMKATGRPLPRRPVRMEDVVFTACQRLEVKMLNRNAVVSHPETWPHVSGVGEWLEVVWGHLLMNALQRSGEKPKITLGWKEQAGQAKFWVVDDGPVVPEPMRGRLFQPFNILHETNDAGQLPLSLVQRLMELQGGGCGYEPDPEAGSRFFFTLPGDVAD